MTILELKQLTKANVMPAINLQIEKGQCVAIQCNNHIGNTLLQLIIGAIPPSSGNVLFCGNELSAAASAKVGTFLLSDKPYERMKVKDYLLFFQRLYNAKESIDEIIQRIGLLDKQNVKIKRLTPSEQRRLQLGRAVLHHPELVILEEPEQNVDIQSTIIIRNLIARLKEENKTVLITTSFLEAALSITDDVYVLNEDGLKKVEAQMEEQEEIEDVLEIVRPLKFERIPAKVNDKLILFDPTEIHFIESSEGTSHIHVREGSFACTLTLSELQEKLQGFGFFRCHRSYLVNLQRVREVITWTRNSYSLILDDERKSSIPLSKGRMDELKDIIGL
ncbi:LytTR family transcriptional regulator DNA-binding domain-containing protein [Microbacteriaceae bacterium 4G12]